MTDLLARLTNHPEIYIREHAECIAAARNAGSKAMSMTFDQYRRFDVHPDFCAECGTGNLWDHLCQDCAGREAAQRLQDGLMDMVNGGALDLDAQSTTGAQP